MAEPPRPRREITGSRGFRGYRDAWKGSTWRVLFDPANADSAHEPARAAYGYEHAIYELAVVHPKRPSKRVKVYVGEVRNYDTMGFERPWMFWALAKAVAEGNSVWFRVKEGPSSLADEMRLTFDYAIGASPEATRRVWLTPRPLGVRVHSEPLFRRPDAS